jgi:hypothetical protein
MSKLSLEVKRNTDNGVETIGEMNVLNEQGASIFKCFSLELPWKSNENRISCIPKSVYLCKKVDGTHNIPYKHISITSVSNRSGVCIHRGNLFTQILGCIIVGDKLADINNDKQIDVTNSTATFDKLMGFLPEEFKLEIK